jgi:hypothetical protein
VAGINFATWMSFTVPLMIVNLFFAWIWLAQMSAWTVKKSEPQDVVLSEVVLPIEQKLNGTVAVLQTSDSVTDVVVTLNPAVDILPQSPIVNRKRHQGEKQNYYNF